MSSKLIPGLILAALALGGGTVVLHSVSTHPTLESFPDPALDLDMDRSVTKASEPQCLQVDVFGVLRWSLSN